MIPLLCAAMMVASFPSSSWGDVVNNGPIFGTFTAGSFAPLGQTFVSVDLAINVIGLEMSIANANQPAPPPITFNLYDGEGVGGPLIASRTIPGPPDTFPMPPRFLTADFSGTTLSVGDSYTITVVDPTDYWGVSVTQDLYSGGSSVLCGTTSVGCFGFEPSQYDLKFEVLTTVPEPTSCWLLGSALAILLLNRPH